MSQCKNCGVTILDDAEICPLCGFALENPHDGENIYPDITGVTKKITMIARIYLTAAIMISGISIAVNYLKTPDVLWCLVVIGGLILTYLSLKVLVEYEFGYHVRVYTTVFAALGYMILIDAVFGFQRWSLNYLFPVMILGIELAAMILMITNFRNWQSYLSWQMFMIGLSILAVILGHFGIITRPRMSWITLGISIFIFIGTVIIGGRRARTELKRRFHIG